MAIFLNDNLDRSSPAFLVGSSAIPTGGAWSAVANGNGTANPAMPGGAAPLTGDITFFYKNAATPASADYTVTGVFTAAADNWQFSLLARVSASDSYYQFFVSSGGARIDRKTSSDGTVGTQIGADSVNVSIAASNRTAHTLTFTVNGTSLSATVDGVAVQFGAGVTTLTDSNITAAGVAGMGGRQSSIDSIVGDTLGGGGDTTPPTLTSPTGTSTGSTTASGTVSTDEANGTLYRLASTNATESAATVKAAALTQSVTATGSQAVVFTGLSPSTTYYAHYVHTDSSANDSARVSSASFTTAASGDTTPPTLSSPTGTATSATTATGSVSTNEANGTLYYVTTVNATETGATVKAGSSQAVTATGVQSVSRSGLTASTTYRHHFLHRDAAGNDSAVSSSATFTTSAAPSGGTLTLTSPLCNNTGQLSGLWVNQTGITLTVLPVSTKASVLVVTGRATNASGVLTSAITDAAITAGQTYRVVPWLGSDAGISQVLTAT